MVFNNYFVSRSGHIRIFNFISGFSGIFVDASYLIRELIGF